MKSLTALTLGCVAFAALNLVTADEAQARFGNDGDLIKCIYLHNGVAYDENMLPQGQVFCPGPTKQAPPHTTTANRSSSVVLPDHSGCIESNMQEVVGNIYPGYP